MRKLTVLMPVYNAERYLAVAIESILGQTFGDFEFLIIDDASTDRSGEILSSYEDPRIRCLRNSENRGIAATLNRGITAAETELIARMDADDVSHPERLRKQYEYMTEHPDCALLSTLTRNIGENGEDLGANLFETDHFYFNLTFYCWIYHPATMYRKSVVQELGLYPARLAEDYLLWCRLIRDHRFATLPECLFDYRVTSQSTCNVVSKEGYSDAEKEQILDNLRYFMGESYAIPESWLECYRNNFEPLVTGGSVAAMAACVLELDRIADRIARKENINRVESAVRQAAASKQDRILRALIKRLGWPQRIVLLARTGSVRTLGEIILAGGGRKVRLISGRRKVCKPVCRLF